MASTSPTVKLAAMRRVQQAALDLFEARGFDEVSVADVAEASDVAPRTVYRYFGTKEGIVLWNESDEDFLGRVHQRLGELGLRDALRAAVDEVDGRFTAAQRATSSRQVAVVDATPQLQAHLAATVAASGRRLGVALARSRQRPDDDRQSQLDATVAVTALFAATLDWERSGRQGSLDRALADALDNLETWAER